MVNGFDDFLINLHTPQEFRRIVNRLMSLEYGDDFACPDDDRSDQGNDGYIKSKKRIHAVHCFKKEQYSDAKVRKKMLSDLSKAVALNKRAEPTIKQWSFITAYRLSEGLMTEAATAANQAGFEFIHQGPDQLAAMMARHLDEIQDIPQVAFVVKLRDAQLTMNDGTEEKPDAQLESDLKLRKIPMEANDEEFANIRSIASKGRSYIKGHFDEVTRVYFSGRSHLARLQAGLILLEHKDPSETSFIDKVALIDSLSSLARMIGDSSILAILYAERGQTFSLQFTLEDLRISGGIEMGNIFGIQSYSPEEITGLKQGLRDLQASYRDAFNRAIELAFANDWKTLGDVAMRIGNAAGGRYLHFHGCHLESRAESEKYVCKRIFDIAQDAFISAKDYDGQLMAQHNLANQLRCMGEEVQAKQIIEIVVKEARKNGFENTLERALELRARLA